MFSQYWIAGCPGCTVTAAQAAIIQGLGGVTATAAEINAAVDDLTATAVEITNKCDGDNSYVAPTASTAMAGAIALTAAQTGKTIFIGATTANTAITLPAEVAGLNYKIVYTNSAAEAQSYTIGTDAAANFFIGGLAFLHVGSSGSTNAIAGVYSDGDSNSLITLVAPAAGTYVELICDGTHWYITGQVVSATIPTIADT